MQNSAGAKGRGRPVQDAPKDAAPKAAACPVLRAAPQRSLSFHLRNEFLPIKGRTPNIHLGKPLCATFLDYLTVLWDTWVFAEINCERFLLLKQRWLEEARQRAARPKALFYFYTHS